ncbi:sodium:solute symporter [Bythopirellula polymerisocia]|uniref:Sodium/glucose cotransporter n=1 Tax=Bythopirellula polymerisocia TaxID=2528003 RepID=A0A5C6CH25_9BACT|nr:sodium:solute symporter [Bythopirellula polymerisocia]TWU23648.1 Sodium/glucose cotransporter [Bythopirellula polymerisocia]
MNLSIHPIDAAIVIGYLAAAILLGLWVGRGQKSTVDYFLGNRSLPTWAVLLSIVATETSTVTFLSIPGFTFAKGGDMRFLQITFGYIVGRFLVIWILLPRYFEGQIFTAYEVLQQRFGVSSRRVTSALFLVTRNLSDALRLYLTALALQQVLGLDLSSCIVLLGLVTIIYTFLGGVKSVVWNDCLQFFIYILGAVAALWLMITRLPGGWEQFTQFGEEFQKFHIFDFDLSLTKPTMTFWSGLIGGVFLTAATHGTDQLMVQRYLTSRSQRSASWALGLSGLIVCCQFALFLFIGVALACFYREYPPDVPFGASDGDKVFAHFIVNYLGHGLVGLTLSAVFAAAMSTLSSSLNSSATVLVQDIYLPLTRQELSPSRQLFVSRIATVGFGLLQIGIAIASYHFGATESTVNSVLSIASFALGPLLGLYLLAVLTKRVRQRAALTGFCIGVGSITAIALTTDLYWAWYAGTGALITLLSGFLTSYCINDPLNGDSKQEYS